MLTAGSPLLRQGPQSCFADYARNLIGLVYCMSGLEQVPALCARECDICCAQQTFLHIPTLSVFFPTKFPKICVRVRM